MFNPQNISTFGDHLVKKFQGFLPQSQSIHGFHVPKTKKAEMSGPSLCRALSVAISLDWSDSKSLQRSLSCESWSRPGRKASRGLWMDANDAMFHGFSIIFPVLWKKRESFFHQAALKRFSKCEDFNKQMRMAREKRFKMVKWQLKYLGFSGFIES